MPVSEDRNNLQLDPDLVWGYKGQLESIVLQESFIRAESYQWSFPVSLA